MFNLFVANSHKNLRRLLNRFSFNFFLLNTFLSLLVGINYIHFLPKFMVVADTSFTGILLWLFAGISYLAQMGIIFFLGFAIVSLISLILPRPRVIFTFTILLGTILVGVLVADYFVFVLFHMHYAKLGLEVIRANALSQVISLSYREMISLFATASILICAEVLLARVVWAYSKKKQINKWSNRVAIVVLFCIVASYSFNFIARQLPGKFGLSASNANLAVKTTRFIPYYDEIFLFLMPINNKLRMIATNNGVLTLPLQQSTRTLQYPRNELSLQETKQKLNIVMIVLDTWRYDTMNAEVTPNIYQFAQKSLQFQNHWSGGNCTKAGMFSLFYGLPENYWQAMFAQKRGPELIHQLIAAKYSMGIFASAQLNFPAFDRTLFREVQPLIMQTPGETTISRDKAITTAFQTFLTTRDKQQPFFSLIFYDAAHNYCEQTVPDAHPFKPWQTHCNRFSLSLDSNREPYLNRYRNAVYFIDGEVKKVLASLEQQDLLKNTIVIITADHGEEINDQRSGYWQHASAYTSYQLHTPFIMYWPGMQAAKYSYLTSHYDFVPTVMTKVLNCKNALADYTIGHSIFDNSPRSVLISGGYADYAIISKDQILRIYRNGDYVIDDARGQPIERANLQLPPLQQALKDINYYFKKIN